MIETTVVIEGMSCGMCESHINDTIRRAFKVKKVSSSHKSGTTTILSESELDREALKKAIDETGYTFVSAASEPVKKRGLFGR